MTIRFPTPTWLVGCGNMAGAMVEGWGKAGIDLDGVTAIRPSGLPVEGILTRTDYPAGETPRLVMLGFKPQKLDEVVPLLAPRCRAETVIVSLLAGVEIASLRARFPQVRAVIRAMPNLPVAIGQGVVALFGDDGATDEVAELMGPLGLVVTTNTEAGLAAIGAIAGAGPAYVARFAEALAAAGQVHGVEADALAIALQTLAGTATLMQANGEDGAGLAKRVASPGGTTQAGLDVLDRGDALARLVEATIAAAIARGRQLAAAAAVDNPVPLA
ncbi:MAG: pyrroline-5-carboxylate reductase dimerization domain-containing protein [Sphingomicrobium sp.]